LGEQRRGRGGVLARAVVASGCRVVVGGLRVGAAALCPGRQRGR
nr:hypothetical protein [Tanacetum cinerariifolium]